MLDHPPSDALLPRNLTASERTHARAFRDHEHRVVALFPDALAREPSLTPQEWAQRNPFKVESPPEGS